MLTYLQADTEIADLPLDLPGIVEAYDINLQAEG